MNASPHSAPNTVALSTEDLIGAVAGAPAATPRATRSASREPPRFILAIGFLTLLALVALGPGLFTGYDPLTGDVTETLQAPSWAHPFGTDRLGRDVLARILYGTRYSLLIGLAGMAVSAAAGVLLGVLAGLSSRLLDEAVSRLFDVLSSFPGVLLAMLVVTFLGQGMANIALAVGIAGIPKFGRVVRAQTQLVRGADYVTHAAIYGLGRGRIFLRHVLPNVLVAVPVIATIYIGNTILVVSGLSFLGLGPQPPTPEWGVMLAESRDVLRVAWWPGVFPGLAVTLTVIAFSIVGGVLQKRFEGRLA